MRGLTHAVLGAAVAVPLALQQPPPLAVACLLIGSVGGGMPDWIDFRSGMRRPFVPRHRGASHGLPVMAVILAALVVAWNVILRQVPEWTGRDLRVDGMWPSVLLVAFIFGWISHLASDACTIGGIQPWLPFSRWRMWLVPRVVRSRYDGYLDKLVRLIALATVGLGIVVYVAGR